MLAWMGGNYLGLNYWVMLILAPVVVGIIGIVIERTMLRWIYKLDHLYGLLLTFGITLVLEGVFRSIYGVSGQPFDAPTCSPARPISASCSCRTIARGWWWLRSWCASQRGS